jgi:hypothetical protein
MKWLEMTLNWEPVLILRGILFFFFKCKISLCGWPKLQIAYCGIKNNAKALGVGQNHNLVSEVKFCQNT